MEVNGMTIDEKIAEAETRLKELKREKDRRERGYPCVKCASEEPEWPFQVVFFTEPEKGIGVNNRGWEIGTPCGWVEDRFRLFTGTIRFEDGQPVETKEGTDRNAWLVESKNRKPALYLYGEPGYEHKGNAPKLLNHTVAVTPIPSLAIRFSRKEDAEQVIKMLNMSPDEFDATEHIF
jgi:hypothetical protein